jgi:hypothetical protein
VFPVEAVVVVILVVAAFAVYVLAALGLGADSRDTRWGILR